MCSEGQYQNLTGQSSCKSCDENTVSSVDRTTCVGMSILWTSLFKFESLFECNYILILLGIVCKVSRWFYWKLRPPK